VTVEAETGGTPITVTESEPARAHAVRLEGLEPGTGYRYRIDPPGLAGEGRFRTPPADDRAPVRFAAVGDSGTMPWWFNAHALGWARLRPLLAWTDVPMQWQVARWIARTDPDFFVHLGDIAYWPYHLREAHEEGFFRPFAPVLQQAALYVITGNHDYPIDGSPPPYDALFQHPESDAPSGRSYSFAWGSVRVVAVDNPAAWWKADTPLHAWLDRTLAEVREPWLVVVTHTPCASAYRPEKGIFQKGLCRLLEQRGVDLVISGDDHLYQRFEPRVPEGPIQITAGGGGKDLYPYDADHPGLAAAFSVFSFFQVEVDGAELTGRAIGEGGRVLDEFHIDRRSGSLPSQASAERRARIRALRP
jgi:hypothetical protein